MAGLNRDEIVFLNRMEHEYAQDELPNVEQIRHDYGRVTTMLRRLNKEIGKLLRAKD